jgi:beta-glucosidase
MNLPLSCKKNFPFKIFTSADATLTRLINWSMAIMLLWLMVFVRTPSLAAKSASDYEHCEYGITPAEIQTKVNELLGRMTLDEKIKLLSGNPKAMGTQGIRRLGIPVVNMRDASCGMGDWGRSTGYPASVCLAATWNRKLAYTEGVAIAHDALARGINIVLGPGMNVEREPQDGRNFEFLGEDPFLTSKIAVQWIRGLQSRGVAACAKHFVGYEDGLDTSIDSIMSRRTLEELYLPPFRAAVRQGHVWSIMCAYYKLNGTYCSRNKFLLTDILRRHWGFKGVLMSDWGANHACARSLNAGLDLEMPQAGFYSQSNIRNALADGEISVATIDQHARRILRLIVGMGLLQHHHHPDYNIPMDDPASAAVAMRVAAEGTVLLKNKHHILPLHRTKLKRIVVWGPMATRAITSGGGSAYVHPIHGMVSMLDAVTKAAGPNVKVQYVASPLCVYSPASPFDTNPGLLWGKGQLLTRHGQPGVTVEYFNNDTLTGPPVATGIDSKITFNWKLNMPVPQVTQAAFSARWRGEIKPKVTGSYEFVSSSDDGSRVFLNGKEIINNWQQHALTTVTVEVWLHAGRTYRLRVEYFNAIELAQMEFGYGLIGGKPYFNAIDRRRISRANVVIACVGFGPKYEGEGVDRGYHLWGLQDRLLRYVAKHNKHTIVVVNAGAGIGMARWIHKVAGLVYAWYPGENGNTAVAGILFGRINPSGRLPDTFSRHWRNEPAYGTFPAVNNVMHFTSGIYTGYRWYDKMHIKPLYPFGYGLSYTTFAMRHLRVISSGKSKQRTITVTAQVTNTGHMAGAEVVQLYIHPLVDRKNRCVQTLKGFARVNLRPGQSKTVQMKLDWRDFAYYDTAAKSWRVPPGKYEIAVGSSSADEPLHQVLRW